MDNKKELSSESLEKIAGGITIDEYTDRNGNKHIRQFGVLDFCTGCGACQGACPVSAISMGGNGATINEGSCILCYACADVCPVGSIVERETIIKAEQ